jgi:thiamine pyrophosphate-dependent acetolactate synthase large subunit-like protein
MMEFETAFQQALACHVPVVIVAEIDPEINVSPMLYPGQPINKFVE